MIGEFEDYSTLVNVFKKKTESSKVRGSDRVFDKNWKRERESESERVRERKGEYVGKCVRMCKSARE